MGEGDLESGILSAGQSMGFSHLTGSNPIQGRQYEFTGT
jgi:hypothetical protein